MGTGEAKQKERERATKAHRNTSTRAHRNTERQTERMQIQLHKQNTQENNSNAHDTHKGDQGVNGDQMKWDKQRNMIS